MTRCQNCGAAEPRSPCDYCGTKRGTPSHAGLTLNEVRDMYGLPSLIDAELEATRVILRHELASKVSR